MYPKSISIITYKVPGICLQKVSEAVLARFLVVAKAHYPRKFHSPSGWIGLQAYNGPLRTLSNLFVLKECLNFELGKVKGNPLMIIIYLLLFLQFNKEILFLRKFDPTSYVNN